MSLVTVLWSMGAATSLTLAAVYGAVWALDRRLVPHLYFGVAAVSTAAMARCELGMMHATSPEVFGDWMHWYYVPVFFSGRRPYAVRALLPWMRPPLALVDDRRLARRSAGSESVLMAHRIFQ
jgi:hypothetical protein